MAALFFGISEYCIPVLEAVAISVLAYSLVGEKLDYKKLIPSAVVTGIVMGAVKQFLPIPILPFIFHVLLYLLILSGAMYLLKVSVLWRTAAAVSFAIPIYLIIELLNMGTRHFLKTDVRTYTATFGARMICFLPQFFATLLLALIFYWKKIQLFTVLDEEVE